MTTTLDSPSSTGAVNPAAALPEVVRALTFAAAAHRDQRRKDECAAPYINHPIALLDVLVSEGGVDHVDVLCAALLHDTLEDTKTTAAELEEAFGTRVTQIVLEVTDDRTLPKAIRKRQQVQHARHASDEAKLVKLADKICNVRDILASPPAGWDAARKREYLEWSGRVVDGVRGIHPGLEARFDALLARRDELG